MRVLLFLFPIILFCAHHSKAQTILSGDAEISLITCDPGSQLYSTFGHTAIRVKDPTNRIDVAFNYGIFDFDTPGFYTKFLRGKLDYMLGAYPFKSFMREYVRDKRTVTEQILALDSIQKKQVFDFLVNNAKEENRYYKYDFFFDNCSTRARDIFISTLGWNISKEPSIKTFRNLLDEYLSGLPWSDFGIDLVIGAIADQKASPYHQTFLPDYLMTGLDDNGQLVAEKDQIIDHKTERLERFKTPWLSPMLVFCLLLVIEILLSYKFLAAPNTWLDRYDQAWFILLAFCSILLSFMWFGTEHMATKQNWNLLWISPLYLAYLLKLNQSARRYIILGISILSAATLLLWTIIPQSYHLAFIPIICINIIKLWRDYRRSVIAPVA